MCCPCAKKLKTTVMKRCKQFFQITSMSAQLLLLGHCFNMIQICIFVILIKFCKHKYCLYCIILLPYFFFFLYWRQEMFYQIMMYEFGNLGVIKFSVSFDNNLWIICLMYLKWWYLYFSECIICLRVDTDSIRIIWVWIPSRRG